LKGTKEFFLSKITKNKEKILVIKKAIVYLHRNQTTDRADTREIKNRKYESKRNRMEERM
jgi:hypothetical protein